MWHLGGVFPDTKAACLLDGKLWNKPESSPKLYISINQAVLNETQVRLDLGLLTFVPVYESVFYFGNWLKFPSNLYRVERFLQ